jgi:cobalt-zinc-cadmium efflux system membrane fusion protein
MSRAATLALLFQLGAAAAQSVGPAATQSVGGAAKQSGNSAGAAAAQGSDSLGLLAPRGVALTAREAERLGIESARAEHVQEFAVAAAPATVVVPPSQEFVVSAPVAGLVTRLFVAEGSRVEAGDPLVELRSTELLALEREYLEAVAADRLATAQLTRDRGLRAEGIIADRRLEETKAQAEAARIHSEQTRQALRLAGFEDADLERLAATGRLVPTLTLKAPAAGTIVAREGSVGAQVQPLEPVLRVADLGVLWLEAHLPQERADAVAPGMRMSIETRGHALTAEIVHVAQVVNSATQTVLVRAELQNRAGLLRAGQSLGARILAGAVSGAGSVLTGNSKAVAVPAEAVVRLDGAAYVFVRNAAGFALVPVQILGRDDARTYLEGPRLDASAAVAVKGVSALKSLLVSSEAEG